ncbi:MAG: LPS assembly protein LptD [Acidobacteria bacterium]|nr:LPS assembly protein LptD [Acidobacteriota bacterium]
MRRGARCSVAAWIVSVCACVVPAALLCASARAQEPNPVVRRVENPITDQPNVNPLQQNQPIRPRRRTPVGATGVAGEDLAIDAATQTVTGEKGAHVFVYVGNVDARVGIYRLQADKLTYYEASQKLVAEGNVVFDQGDAQRITGSRAEFNARTKLGFFVNATGFTNQTDDGTTIYFTADSVERVSTNRVRIINGTVTACDEETPKWSFTARRAEITLNDRVRIKRPVFRVKGVPVLPLPYASVSIKKRDRASGFLTPTFSGSGKKGFRLSNAYYQTLGRSADVTLRSDIFTKRGVGFGADVRTMANSRSFLYFGFYAVKDRVFGAKASPQNPDQGGTSFYADGVHYFPNGFVAAVDIHITSNLAFRQIFSDDIQRAISPEERSQVYVNKNSGAYSFNFLARSQVTSVPNTHIRIRELPSIEFERRPTPLDFFKKHPVYFSFDTAIEGMSRKETVEDLAAFRAGGSANPVITPSLVQRLRVRPQASMPFQLGGWDVTATASLDGDYYSNSIDPTTRLVLGQSLTRFFGEFDLDVRPPALAKNFYHPDGSLRFRHVVEPYLTYRRIAGVGRNDRTILFDYLDAVADTNEIEYGVTNRFFTRRSSETVTGRVPVNGRKPGDKNAKGGNAGTGTSTGTNTSTTGANANGASSPLTSQPYEALSITVRQKYFFDPYFGGALVAGRRNQFFPVNTFSGFTYGGVPRRFSPVNVEARVRPRYDLFADVRTDLDVSAFGVRDLAVSFGYVPRRHLVEAFTTFYYTRAVSLAPSLARFADSAGKEPGTLKGAQWSPTVFLGSTDKGLFGGTSIFFDFQNRPGKKSPLVSTTFTLGYAWDCCNVTVQDFFYNIGLRKENRVVFSFRLNGIGTFGTEQFGQHFR